jgi:ABC-type Fe3+-hydroxamate transport system substrate-binding protein
MHKTAIVYGFIAMIIVAGGGGNAFASQPSINNSSSISVAPDTDANQQLSSNSEVRVINHAMGQTEIRGTPQRLVTLYSVFTGDVRALGVQPVGTADRDWINGWLTPLGLPLSNDVVDVGLPDTPNLETILELQPDLIIGHGGHWGVHDEMYEELNAIAPTLVFDDTPRGNDLDELETGLQNFMSIADALNRHQEGIGYLERLEAIYADAAQEITLAGHNGTKFVLAQAYLSGDVPGAYVFTNNSFSTKVLNKIALINEVPDPENSADKWYEIGMEGFATIDKPDTHLIVTYNAGQYETNPLERSPLWNNLEFVRDGRAHDIGHTRVFGQVIFIEEIVNKVVDALTNTGNAGSNTPATDPMT